MEDLLCSSVKVERWRGITPAMCVFVQPWSGVCKELSTDVLPAWELNYVDVF